MNNRTLDSLIDKRSNNLQLIRFIAAIFVIIGHAFVLCESNKKELIYWISGKEITLGRIAVAIFFFASGFFVTRSIEKKNGFVQYFKARIIRIFPLLFCVVVLTIIMGFFVTSLPKIEYILNLETWKYLLNFVLLLQHNLPGVFVNNAYGSVVNGALWTLPVEFVCYVACYIFYHIGILEKKVMKYTIILCAFFAIMCVYVGQTYNLSIIEDTGCLCAIFYIGMLYYVFREKIKYNNKYFIIMLFLFVISILLHKSWIGILLFFPYMLSYVFFMPKQVSNGIANLGDYSYAMYLCGFPIQQLVIFMYGGNMNPFWNIAIVVPVVIFISYFLNLLEKKFIRRLYV